MTGHDGGDAPVEPRRVLVATTVHHPHDARILHRQIAALLDAGWEVTYVAPFEADASRPEGIRTVPVPRASGRRRLRALRDARRTLRRLAPDHDLILIHDPDLLPAVWRLAREQPVVWDVHEDTAAAVDDRAWIPTSLKGFARWIVRRVERRAERRLNLILAEESYRDRFRGDHPVIPNRPWSPSSPGAPTGDPRVIYVGRLSRGRGLVELVALGERLQPGTVVTLVGAVDDTDRELLETASRNGKVDWRGFLPNDQALELVRGSVCGLSLLHDDPNYHGSMPTKVLEYLAHGVPAITTPLPLARDLVEAHHAGFVVPFEDVETTATLVTRLVEDQQLQRRLGANGYRAVQDELGWERVVPRFLRSLEEAHVHA